ncbi:helix-turn-helix domain-containing protein [Lacrimispora defluvii]|uniref:Helix-turn-helix transcriptional regulator n=1 Tax=Lacrimispora defluvii TaxID=2719233 RepID=A0ABX1VX04_9FIRM|nr:helix-turn-helix transcriptional regulator [Lacrimispora defluvii]NNJ30713.1 helix-turn-helix transcriptional regulator [Lacrimispora defluvii]
MSITGQRIKERRKQLEMSADDVAAELGVSRSTIFRYENGQIEKVPANVLEKLAVILRTTPAYLMGWQDDCIEYPVTGADNSPWIHRPASGSEDFFREDEGKGYHTYNSLGAIINSADADDRDKITAMAKIYLTLTDSGKRKANDYMVDLSEQPKYRKS